MPEPNAFSESAILARLDALEKKNRRLKSIGLLILLGIGAALTMAQTRAVRSLEGRKFVLKDAKGKRRAELGFFPERPELVFYDAEGARQVSIGVGADGPGLVIMGPRDERSAVLAQTAAGPALSMHAASGARRLNLSVTRQGPTVGLLTESGEAKGAFGMMGNDGVFLQLFGAREAGGAQLFAASQAATLRFLDSSNRARAVLGILADVNAPGLVFNDPNGTLRASMILNQNGPGIALFDGGGKAPVWRAP
jgi:hypothetical protein